MEVMETWIYALVDTCFVKSNGVEYACALSGSDVQLFGDYDVACAEKTKLQEGYYEQGFHLAGSDYQSSDKGVCYWSRVENWDGVAHVLAIHKKVVVGDLFQVRHS